MTCRRHGSTGGLDHAPAWWEKGAMAGHASFTEERDTARRSALALRLEDACQARDAAAMLALLNDLHPADIASALADIEEDDARLVLGLIGADLDPEVLTELNDDLREIAFEVVPSSALAEALEDLDTDDAADLAADLEGPQREQVLSQASDEVRQAIEGALSFDEDTVGRLMQREFVAAPELWNVGKAIDHMRETGEDLPDLFFDVYLVDAAMRPVGAVPVSRIMRSPRKALLKDLSEPLPIIVTPDQDQEDVAVAFQRYHLISAPVVDEAGRLNGMMTVDDMVHVIQEEGAEDMLALAGVTETSMSESVFEAVGARLPWLSINVLTALVAATMISRFGALLEQVVALAILMPIVASLGGNAGTQTLAVSVRMLASRELMPGQALGVVGKELLTALFNGTVIAIILAVVAGLWFQRPEIAVAIGTAVILNFAIGGLAGILVPLTLKRFGQDPAVSSSVFVTFTTDVVGFVGFLSIAWLILSLFG